MKILHVLFSFVLVAAQPENPCESIVQLKYVRCQGIKNWSNIGAYISEALRMKNSSLADLEIIRIQQSNIDELAFSDLSLPSLKLLIIHSSNISVLSSENLISFRQLETLTLEENQIKNYEPGALLKLNLKSLTLSRNSGNWEELLSSEVLQSLRLRYDLKNITGDALENCTELLYLNLADCNITHLPNGLFRNLRKLTTLTLADNVMSNFSHELFEPLQKLTALRLDDNCIRNLPDGVFSSLVSLKKLHLNYNNLDVRKSLFLGLQALTKLGLTGNSISELPDGAFEELVNLEELNLDGNEIRELPVGAFRGLENLKVLMLNRNFLKDVSFDVFESNDKLELLSMSYNQIATLKRPKYAKLANLRTLALNLINFRNPEVREFYAFLPWIKIEFDLSPQTAYDDPLWQVYKQCNKLSGL